MTWFGFNGVQDGSDDITYTDITDLDGFFGFA
jgi:hypothetical protein